MDVEPEMSTAWDEQSPDGARSGMGAWVTPSRHAELLGDRVDQWPLSGWSLGPAAPFESSLATKAPDLTDVRATGHG